MTGRRHFIDSEAWKSGTVRDTLIIRNLGISKAGLMTLSFFLFSAYLSPPSM